MEQVLCSLPSSPYSFTLIYSAPVTHLLDTFLPKHAISPIITRAFRPPKPDPTGLLYIAHAWSVLPIPPSRTTVDPISPTPNTTHHHHHHQTAQIPYQEAKKPKGQQEQQEPWQQPRSATDAPLPLIMVGDSIDDMAAGRRAGFATVLLRNGGNAELAGHEWTDLAVDRLDELIAVLDEGFVGGGGE